VIERLEPTRTAALALAALAMVAPASHATEGRPYPRLANVYLVGHVDPNEVRDLAQWDVLVLNTVWPDSLLQEMRSINPHIKIFLYACHYCLQDPPPVANWWEWGIHDYVLANDLWWYNRDIQRASDWVGASMINITKFARPGPNGMWWEYFARQVESLMAARPNVSGIYFDNYYRWVSWQLVQTHVDSDCNPTHNPAGCDGVEDTPATLDGLWNHALHELAKSTRARFDVLETQRPNIDLGIVGGRSGDYFEYLNGTFYENFPNSHGGITDPGTAYRYNWNMDMFEYPEGYLMAPVRTTPFTATILNANQWGSAEEPARNPDFERYKRFTLGSALLGDGYYSLDIFTHQNRWWEPEYDNGGRGKGYLGYPTGPYRHVLEPTGPEMVVNGSFTSGVQPPWIGQSDGLPANLVWDTTEYHSAPASAKIDVVTPVAGTTFKLWQLVGPLTGLDGYTLSFWAKASQEQEIVVDLYSEQCPSSRCLNDRRVHLTTEWKLVQIPFLSRGTSTGPGLNVFIEGPGDVWVDDVSLRAGDTSVYRRDFDRGTVIVNYTTTSQTVDLGGTYYRLDAPGWPLYDGAAVTSETILPSDARILLTQPTQTTDVAPRRAGNRLDAATPNPFNPTTRIGFALERRAAARLAVYDVAGRRVRVLVDAVLEAGEHVATWDGRDAAGAARPSGVYLYRLDTPGFTRAHRMTLVR
jgi:hypothetical protein